MKLLTDDVHGFIGFKALIIFSFPPFFLMSCLGRIMWMQVQQFWRTWHYNLTYMKILAAPASWIPHIKSSAASDAFEEGKILKMYSAFPPPQFSTSQTI